MKFFLYSIAVRSRRQGGFKRVKLVSPVIRGNRKSWGHVLYHRRAKPPLSES